MASFFSRLSPVPSFPPYTGPYQTGTVDVERSTAGLSSPALAPDASVSTIQFRIFYPCQARADREKPVRWLPHPQRDYVGAYARFLGARGAYAEILSRLLQLLYYITIPAEQNAPLLLPATTKKRWPVMVFSHGLGGSRNAYSHLLGSLASHGVVVVAPEHRDGSAPVSFIGDDPDKKGRGRRVEFRALPYKPSPDVYEARDEQLRVRCWELGLVHEAVLQMDSGDFRADDVNLKMFENRLDVHDSGRMSWAGHSFGATTVYQFVKSVAYPPPDPPVSGYSPQRGLSQVASQSRRHQAGATTGVGAAASGTDILPASVGAPVAVRLWRPVSLVHEESLQGQRSGAHASTERASHLAGAA